MELADVLMQHQCGHSKSARDFHCGDLRCDQWTFVRRSFAVEMQEFKSPKPAGLSFKLRLHVQKHCIANGANVACSQPEHQFGNRRCFVLIVYICHKRSQTHIQLPNGNSFLWREKTKAMLLFFYSFSDFVSKRQKTKKKQLITDHVRMRH